MANSIEPTVGLVVQNFVGPTSRYLNSELVTYNADNAKYLTFKTWKRPARVSSPDDQVYVVNAGTQYRPDIVAKKKYGREGWWWVILLANGMSDVMEFEAGRTVVLPTPFQ